MNKEGIILLFITFFETIITILVVQCIIKSPIYVLNNIHPVILIILLIQYIIAFYNIMAKKNK